MPIKRLLDPRRMRKAPPRGFGWIDHRLLRDGYIGRCSPQALALYVLLVCASDAQGLSYYSDPRIAQLLTLELATLSLARQELIDLGLIAYQKPLYQLLSLEGQELTVGKSRTPLISRPSREQQLPPANCEPQPAPAISGLSLKAMVESLLQKRGEPK
ncbi:MAG: hypothetical protein JOZ61_08640 [Verrucomicrobia bacterium]|nr:hypothetical protein [Verrucomicrobiota bacterium]